MCVIIISRDVRPSEDLIEKAYKANDAGAGVAWREEGVVKWEKGLEVKRVKELCAEVPLPFIAHFRIPSVGGPREDLCHPFPIERTVPLSLKGKTKGQVLFHNGHWTQWRDSILAAIKGTTFKIPTGKWSDTRAMAWYAAHYGTGVLEFINEKTAVFGPGAEDLEIFGDGWVRLDEGLYASNKSFDYCSYYTGGMNWRSTDQGRSDSAVKEGIRQSTGENRPTTDLVKHGDGGAPKESPFDRARNAFELACKHFKEGKMSRKKFKKARRAWDVAQMEEKNRQGKLKN